MMQKSAVVRVVEDVSTSPLAYLDRAFQKLRSAGLSLVPSTPGPTLGILVPLVNVDEQRVTAIARVLQQSSLFNAAVRDEIRHTRLGDRYDAITSKFDSIRDDGKRLLAQLADGQIDWREKSANLWMRVHRGSIPARYEAIRRLFGDVAKDSLTQIERETLILEGYLDFRGALKESEIDAQRLLAKAAANVTDALRDVEAAQQALSGDGLDPTARSQCELLRDQKVRAHHDAEKTFQVAKDLKENLTVAYNTSEVVMARLKQTTDLKERVYSQSVLFFTTNETVFTALSAATTAQAGLHESTQTLNAMKSGMNKSIESLTEIGGTVLDNAVEAGYGPTIAAESVQKLVDAVVTFQLHSRERVAEFRAKSEENAERIRECVEDGKRRLQPLLPAVVTN